MQIREAEYGDRNGVWAMLKPVFRAGDTYAVDSGIEQSAALEYWMPERAYVAVSGGLVGTYYLRENQKGGGAHVCNAGFVTHPTARGQGVARAMLDHALQEARDLGFEAMQFNFVLANNSRAIEIWERTGFEVIGRVPRAFAHPSVGYIDALIMHRFL